MAEFDLSSFLGPNDQTEAHAVKTAYCRRSSCKKFGRCITRSGRVLGRLVPCKPSRKSDLEDLEDKLQNG